MYLYFIDFRYGITLPLIDDNNYCSFTERPSPASKDGSKSKTKKLSYLSCCLQVTGFMILLPILLYTGFTAISTASPSFSLYVGQATADLSYPLQRVVRLVSLPLHRFFDMSKANAWECMVDNPLYVPGRHFQALQ